MQTHTATSLARLIATSMEPEHAERVLAALRPLNGQPITTRLLDKLPGGRVEWRLTRDLGRTQIKNRASMRISAEGIELTLAHSEACVPLDVAWVERENVGYFAARRQRNAARAQAIADSGMLGRVAFAMNEVQDLLQKLAFAKEQFETFIREGEPCYVVRYDLERACGLRKEVK